MNSLSVNSVFRSNAFLAAITGFYLAVFLVTNNLTILPADSIFLIVLLLTVFPVILVGLLQFVDKRSSLHVPHKFIVVFCSVVYLFMFLHLPIVRLEIVQQSLGLLGGAGSLLAKVAYLVLVVLLAGLMGFLFRKDSRILASMLSFMTLIAVATHAEVIGERLVEGNGIFDSGQSNKSGLFTLTATPNIYFILADGYASLAYMADKSINVDRFAGFLEANKFRLYDDTHSNYHPTTASLAATLNMAHHYYQGSREYGEISRAGRRTIAGGNALVDLLSTNGYESNFVHQNTYLLTQGCSADRCFPSIRFAGLKTVLGSAIPGVSGFENNWDMKPLSELESQLNGLLKIQQGKFSPQFNYLHLYFPSHASNRVQGDCDQSEQIMKYGQRVSKANAQLEKIISKILHSDPGAVIVLAGDHGPMITNNCIRKADIDNIEDYRDRVGSFLAIRWPEDYDGRFDGSVKTMVNVFRYVLAAMGTTESEILDGRAAEDVYVQGNEEILRIMRHGEYLIPPERIPVQELRQQMEER